MNTNRTRSGSNQPPLPNRLLDKFTRPVKDLWKKVDFFRSDILNAGDSWDGRVFIPYNEWFRFLSRDFPGMNSPQARLYIANNLSALAAWRPTQDIIRFDPDLYASLIRTELTGNMPATIIKRLPAWGIYVESPGLTMFGAGFEGFFAHLDLCNEPGLMLLGLHFITADMAASHLMLPLGEWSLLEAVDKTNEDFVRGAKKLNRDIDLSLLPRVEDGLAQAINLLVYVCSYGLGGDMRAGAPGSRSRPEPRKIRGVLRFFPPDKPVLRLLGAEFGEQIRKYTVQREAGDRHAAPRPHIRRAHWHGYWEGPIKRESEKPREFRVRWLPPIPVGAPAGDGEAQGK